MANIEKNDIDVMTFAGMLLFLEPHPPVTEELDSWGCSYSSEKAHMCGWFASQTTNGGGSYTRNEPNRSARATYNRLLAPGAMLWIAEVLGENSEQLRTAVQAAKEAEKKNWRARASAFREVIPFERIWELLNQPVNWLYDEQLLPLIAWDEYGYPTIPKEEAELLVFNDVLDKEEV